MSFLGSLRANPRIRCVAVDGGTLVVSALSGKDADLDYFQAVLEEIELNEGSEYQIIEQPLADDGEDLDVITTVTLLVK